MQVSSLFEVESILNKFNEIKLVRLWSKLEESKEVWIRNDKQGVLLKVIEQKFKKNEKISRI